MRVQVMERFDYYTRVLSEQYHVDPPDMNVGKVLQEDLKQVKQLKVIANFLERICATGGYGSPHVPGMESPVELLVEIVEEAKAKPAAKTKKAKSKEG